MFNSWHEQFPLTIFESYVVKHHPANNSGAWNGSFFKVSNAWQKAEWVSATSRACTNSSEKCWKFSDTRQWHVGFSPLQNAGVVHCAICQQVSVAVGRICSAIGRAKGKSNVQTQTCNNSAFHLHIFCSFSRTQRRLREAAVTVYVHFDGLHVTINRYSVVDFDGR